jgi:hypothetical protein
MRFYTHQFLAFQSVVVSSTIGTNKEISATAESLFVGEFSFFYQTEDRLRTTIAFQLIQGAATAKAQPYPNLKINLGLIFHLNLNKPQPWP